MGDINQERNSPHVLKVQSLADQIFAVNATLAYGTMAKDNDFDTAAQAANLVLREIRGAYNNREMSLVCTKLEEATHWAVEKNTTQVKLKLTEARNWAIQYIAVLKEA